MLEQLKFDHCNHSRDPIVSCALEGVASVIAGIQDVSIVIHSPQGCAATVAAAYDAHETDFTKRKVACTRLFESDIIMGASEKLMDLIRQADKSFGASVLFIVGTCSADIIGENLEGICAEMQPEIKAKLIPVTAGGFRGNSYEGMEMGLAALLPIIKKDQPKKEKTVNLIAPQANLNPTWFADFHWVRDILGKLGVEVQTVFSHDTSMAQIEAAGSASGNLLLSHDTGHGFVQKLEKSHGIPLLLGDLPLPVGVKNTSRWIRALGEQFGAQEAAEKLVEEGEGHVLDVLRRRALMLIPRYRNCKVVLSVDGTIGLGLVRMVFEELEMIPELLLFRSALTPAAREILERELDDLGLKTKVAFAVDGYQIKKAVGEVQVDAMIGSSWEKYIAEEAGIKIAFDLLSPSNREVYVDRPYFGYEGALNILEVFANDWERAFRSKAIDPALCD
ncbi:MAG: nitrogenase component 1 [Chthoniobacteraceae bacterium]